MAILIDGYNLLHVTGLVGRGIGPGTLQRCRIALLNCIATSLDADELANTTIVFDAQDPPPDQPHEYQRQGMCVKYSVGYADADSMLEELIRLDSAPRRLTVVSSDHRVQRAARRRRATAVDSDVWFEGLSRRRLPRENTNQDVPAKPIEKLTDADVKMWLDAFSGEPDDDARSERRENGGAVDPDVIDNPFPPGYADDLLEEEE